MRETVVLFNGNELSLGAFLAIWLLWTAAGSGLSSRYARKSKHPRAAVALVEGASGISLIATVWALRAARAYLQTVPGELLGPVTMALVLLASLSAFCALSGCLFALSAELYRNSIGSSEDMGSSNAYLFETAGAALGGILASILMLPLFGSFQITVFVALLNLCLGLSLIAKRRWELAVLIVATLVVGAGAGVWAAPRMEAATQQGVWPGFRLIESQDSVYGRLTLLSAGGLHSIYENGTILANLPDPAAAEETVHYALLEHSDPRRLLLVGGGMNGSIAEALKHATVQQIDYVELDPALIQMYRRIFPEVSASAFSDQRVRVHETDGRAYLRATKELFDVIILGVPEPESAQLNRFYTEEFFRTARAHLAPGGLFALQLKSSEDTISPERADFLRCIDKTLRQVFPQVAVIPGETVHLFASNQAGALTEDPRKLIARLESRNLQTRYVREYFLPFRMAPDRMAQIHELLQPLPTTPVNRDFHPAAYYFASVLWGSQFKTAYAVLLEAAARIRFSVLIAGACVLAILLVVGWIFLTKRRAREAAAWLVCATGYSAMATQILLLLVFQSLLGYVYRELAMLIGMFMGGMATGTWFGIVHARHGDARRLKRKAMSNQLLLSLCTLLILSLMNLRLFGPNWGAEISRLVFPMLALFCGLPCGYQFSICTAIYERGSQKAGSGSLYAFDLLGGSGGALVLAAFLIPVFGFWKTAWLSMVIGLAASLMVALAKSERLATLNPDAGVPQRPPQ
jgi:spermidine synthase